MSLHRGSIPSRLIEALELDGGWLTVEGLALVVAASEASIRRALWRLRRRQEVEHRTLLMAIGDGGKSPERRGEWRFKTTRVTTTTGGP